jgi:hypothetical protein
MMDKLETLVALYGKIFQQCGWWLYELKDSWQSNWVADLPADINSQTTLTFARKNLRNQKRLPI